MSVPPVTVGLVDYGMGNRRSVQKALEHVGARVVMSSEAERLLATDALVLPGVGAFPQAMRNLGGLGLDVLVQEEASRGKPILGICLGMQLLFDRSEELEVADGLRIIPGRVSWLQPAGQSLPHIGWNEVSFSRPSPLLAGLPEAGCPFYHVHSLVVRPTDEEDGVGFAEYGERFASIVSRGNVHGVQFHPEKSSAHGLRLLANFLQSAPAAGSQPSLEDVAARR